MWISLMVRCYWVLMNQFLLSDLTCSVHPAGGAVQGSGYRSRRWHHISGHYCWLSFGFLYQASSERWVGHKTCFITEERQKLLSNMRLQFNLKQLILLCLSCELKLFFLLLDLPPPHPTPGFPTLFWMELHKILLLRNDWLVVVLNRL